MAVFYPLIQHWLSIQYTLGMMKIFKKRKGKNKLCQHTKLRTVSCDQAILISGYIIKKNENICLCKNLQANTHSSIIHRQKWKQPKCPSTDQWMNRTWSIPGTERYPARLKYGVLTVAEKWMNLENTRWGKKPVTKDHKYDSIHACEYGQNREINQDRK